MKQVTNARIRGRAHRHSSFVRAVLTVSFIYLIVCRFLSEWVVSRRVLVWSLPRSEAELLISALVLKVVLVDCPSFFCLCSS